MRTLFAKIGMWPYIIVIFINAFVDLGHKIIVQNTVFKVYDDPYQTVLTAIVNGLILLPFILLFTPAGFLSDKLAKPRIMRAAAWLAVGITLCITFFYYMGWFWAAFGMTFLLAMQSAIYSPAKYGYIKDLVGNNHLTEANGLVQTVTMVAILGGIFAFSVLFEWRLDGIQFTSEHDILTAIAPVGWVLVVGSVIELFCAYKIPELTPNNDMAFDWRKYRTGRYLVQNVRAMHQNKIIWLSIIGLSVFWGLAQALLASFPAFIKQELNVDDTRVIQGLMALTGIGIMLGSIFAGRMSRNYIETGLIPLGAIGLAVMFFILPHLTTATTIGLTSIGLGFLGGIFIIPLNALIQFHAEDKERGRVLAGSNLVQNVVMVGFLVLTASFTLFGLSKIALFHLFAVMACMTAFYTMIKLPQSLVKFLLGTVISRRYRLDVLGFKNIPEHGGVLLLGNHTSWLDWAVIQMAVPRPVRFVMERSIYEKWYLKWFLDCFGVVPISSRGSKDAIKTMSALVNQGEVVCLFPEGTISRTGHLVEFQKGYQLIASKCEQGVIVPFYLRGLWGSLFSRSSQRLRYSRKAGLKRDIIVAFGETQPLSTIASELKKRVAELSISSWSHHTLRLDAIPVSWIKTAKRFRSEVCATDAVLGTFSFHKMLVSSLLFSRLIRKKAQSHNIGLILPTSIGGALTNMAVLLAGRTVVNLNFTSSVESLKLAVHKADIETIITSEKFLQKLSVRGINLDTLFEGKHVLKLEDLKADISICHKIIVGLGTLLPSFLVVKLFGKKSPLHSPAVIMFSSGSEGVPKGVVLSHQNIMANVKQITDVLNIQDDDVVLASLPLFHAFGLTVTTLMPMIEGVPMVCLPDPTDAQQLGRMAAKYSATIMFATSTFLRLYTQSKKVHPLMLQSMRAVIAGGEKLSPAVREKFEMKFKKPVYEGYGATETTPVASCNLPDQLDTSYWFVQQGNKQGSVGMALPGSCFRIVDPTTLAELAAHEDGLILIGGSQLMLGYLKDEAKTNEVIVELDGIRWYKTGDKGHLDEQGFLTIVDRYSRFAKLGGEMVSLTAVEEQISRVVDIDHVEFAAIALPDEKKGEAVVVIVTQAGNPDDIKHALIATGVNPLMLPKTIVQWETIPKLGSGKVDYKTIVTLMKESEK